MDTIKKLKSNKVVLYVLLFIALTNIVGLLSTRDFGSLAFMIVTGLLSSYYSRNMVVILAITLIATNVFYRSKISIRLYEGFDGNKKKDKKKMKKDKKGKKNEKETKKDGFSQRNVPASKPSTLDGDGEGEDVEVGKRVDYAATMEQAYSNLQNMLGTGGIKKLTQDTQGLISQQKGLMKTLDDMQPMMKMAKQTMSGLNLDSMTKSLQSMGSVLGSLKPNN